RLVSAGSRLSRPRARPTPRSRTRASREAPQPQRRRPRRASLGRGLAATRRVPTRSGLRGADLGLEPALLGDELAVLGRVDRAEVVRERGLDLLEVFAGLVGVDLVDLEGALDEDDDAIVAGDLEEAGADGDPDRLGAVPEADDTGHDRGDEGDVLGEDAELAEEPRHLDAGDRHAVALGPHRREDV